MRYYSSSTSTAYSSSLTLLSAFSCERLGAPIFAQCFLTVLLTLIVLLTLDLARIPANDHLACSTCTRCRYNDIVPD